MTDADDVAFDGAPSGETPKEQWVQPGLCKCQGSDPWLHKHYARFPEHPCARCSECKSFDPVDAPAESPRPVRGIPPAISEALDKLVEAARRSGEHGGFSERVTRCRMALESAILSGLPQEPTPEVAAKAGAMIALRCMAASPLSEGPESTAIAQTWLSDILKDERWVAQFGSPPSPPKEAP